MATTKRTKPLKNAARSRATVRAKPRVSRALNTDPRSIALAVGAALLPWGSAYALPTGENVVAGDVTVTRPSSQFMQINQATQKGIVNWTSFSIGTAEHVNVTQLNSASVLLNRVVGNDPSQIFGRLTANGQIFLVNTNGVLFAPSASVEVGALMATSLSINDQDFLAGRYLFAREGNAGSVINQGNIITPNGYTALVGPQVRNDGVIVARAGSVILAAADRVSLDMIGDGLISINVDQAALNASVINTGRIEADGGTVLLTARSANALLDTVINTSGLIRANSLVERDGEIVLDGGNAGVVAVSGRLQAAGVDAGSTGGTIKVLGQYVGLFDHATVNASGDAGGGTVLVGGNFQGKGPEQNAFRTYVDPNAAISADAGTIGNGGTVVVWADDITRFGGTLTARGGTNGGDGGNVEISGKNSLALNGSIDVHAPAGRVGRLLLDPSILDIIDTGAGGTLTAPVAFDDGTGTESVEVGSITGAGSTTLQAGQIRFQNAGDIVMNAGDSVTFTADNGQVTGGTGNSTITNAGGNAFNITTSGTGEVTFFAASSVNLTNITVNSAQAINITGSSITTSTLNAGVGTVNLTSDGTVDASGGAITAGNVNVTASTPGQGTFTLSNAGNAIGTVDTTNSVNTLTVRDDGGLTLAATIDAATLNLQSDGTVNGAGSVITATNVNVTASTAGQGTFTLSNAGNAIGTVDTTNSVNTLTVRDDGGLTLAATIDAATLNLQSDGTVNGAGSVVTATNVNLTASTVGQGTFTLNNAGNALGTVSTTNGVNTVSLRDDAGFALGNITATTLNLQTDSATVDGSGGALTVTNLNVTGTTAGNGTFALSNAGNAIGTVDTTNAVNTLTVRDDGGLTLAATIDATTLNLQSNGTVNGTGSVITATNVNVTASTAGQGTFTLSNAGNAIGTVDTTNAVNTLTVRDDGGLTLAATIDAATLNLQSNGTVNGAGSVITATNVNLTASTVGQGAFTLNNAGNALGTVSTTNGVNSVSLRDDAGFSVGTLTTSNLTLQTTGTVTQSGVITATGLELLGTGGTFTLNTQTNAITTLAANTGTVSLLDAGGIAFGTVNATPGLNLSGSLSITTTGAVTQGATTAVVGGTSSIDAGAGAITLTSANNFQGTVSLTGGTTQITDGVAGTLTLGNVNTGALTVINNGALNLGTGTVNGALSANSTNGPISQTGAIVVTGTSNLQAGTGSIVLSNAANDFQSTVTATGSGGINLVDANTLSLGSLAAGAGVVDLTANAIAGTGAVDGGSGTYSSNSNVVGLVTHITNQLLLTGNATLWNFGSGSSVGSFGVTSQSTSVQINGATFVASLVQQQTAAVIGSVSEQVGAIVTEEANKTFGTDSVAEDVEFGFAGEIGATPPMDHRIDEAGISLPRCVTEAREGMPCK